MNIPLALANPSKGHDNITSQNFLCKNFEADVQNFDWRKRKKGQKMEEYARASKFSCQQYNESYPTFVANFKIPSAVVPEKCLMEKKN